MIIRVCILVKMMIFFAILQLLHQLKCQTAPALHFGHFGLATTLANKSIHLYSIIISPNIDAGGGGDCNRV